MYYLCSKNKGADQLRVYRAADLHLCFRRGKNSRFSQDATHLSFLLLDIIDTLEEENLLLKKKNVGLQEQVTLLEKAVQNLTNEKQSHEDQSDDRENTTGGMVVF